MDVTELRDKLYKELFQSLLAGIIANKVKLLASLPFLNNVLKL